ncbi:MAG: hypothetical protein GX032_04270 [Tenericutes bacterium]|nr:hypothetical protein [Bacilli bacterium]NLV90665.1 hypothetical protein [Mycoplasmatota bacterium]
MGKVKEEKKKEKELEENVKKEFGGYKKDILSKNVDLYDNKPLIQKIIFILVGVINFVVGFALYFLIKDDKNKKWQANYLSKGSAIGLALWIVIAFSHLINLILNETILGCN